MSQCIECNATSHLEDFRKTYTNGTFKLSYIITLCSDCSKKHNKDGANNESEQGYKEKESK